MGEHFCGETVGSKWIRYAWNTTLMLEWLLNAIHSTEMQLTLVEGRSLDLIVLRSLDNSPTR